MQGYCIAICTVENVCRTGWRAHAELSHSPSFIDKLPLPLPFIIIIII